MQIFAALGQVNKTLLCSFDSVSHTLPTDDRILCQKYFIRKPLRVCLSFVLEFLLLRVKEVQHK